MSNLSKLLKFENFNTEHLSVAVDMNSGGEMSKFVIPLFNNFVLRNSNKKGWKLDFHPLIYK